MNLYRQPLLNNEVLVDGPESSGRPTGLPSHLVEPSFWGWGLVGQPEEWVSREQLGGHRLRQLLLEAFGWFQEGMRRGARRGGLRHQVKKLGFCIKD